MPFDPFDSNYITTIKLIIILLLFPGHCSNTLKSLRELHIFNLGFLILVSTNTRILPNWVSRKYKRAIYFKTFFLLRVIHGLPTLNIFY